MCLSSSTLSLFTFSCNFVDVRFQYKLCFRYSVLFISSISQDSKGLEANVVQQFSLDDTRPSFGLFSRYILMLDHTIIVRFVEILLQLEELDVVIMASMNIWILTGPTRRGNGIKWPCPENNKNRLPPWHPRLYFVTFLIIKFFYLIVPKQAPTFLSTGLNINEY